MKNKILYTLGKKTDGLEEFLNNETGMIKFTDDLGDAFLVEEIEMLPEPIFGQYIVRVRENNDGWLRILERMQPNNNIVITQINITELFVLQENVSV